MITKILKTLEEFKTSTVYLVEVTETERSNWNIIVVRHKNDFTILNFYTSWPQLDMPTNKLMESLETHLNN